MTNYPIGDFLTRIKNASMARKKVVEFPATKFVVNVAKCLMKEGYLESVTQDERVLTVTLRYKNKEPLISDVKLVSKPGLRIYKKREDLEGVRGPSIFVLSTPAGVMASREAIKRGLGGEVIVEIL